MSDQLAGEMARRNVKLIPTLAREEADLEFSKENNRYLSDPLFQACAGDRLEELKRQRSAADKSEAETFQRSFDIAIQNLSKLHAAGVQICMGTDTGFRLKLPGYSQHRELALMCRAGLSTSQSLAAALQNNYEFFAHSASKIEPGQPADFFLVKGNPLGRIEDTTKIREVWQAGEVVGNVSV
ncbi:MAG: amidohydrolase family protein [Chthoniobacterales bacterium]|nr:amidohydrolase family protein [Chthoniobacterales bacterium]